MRRFSQLFNAEGGISMEYSEPHPLLAELTLKGEMCCEPFLRAFAAISPTHRFNYEREGHFNRLMTVELTILVDRRKLRAFFSVLEAA